MTPLSPSSSIYHSLVLPSTLAVATTRLVIRNYLRGEARFSKRMDRLMDEEVISFPESIFPTGHDATDITNSL